MEDRIIDTKIAHKNHLANFRRSCGVTSVTSSSIFSEETNSLNNICSGSSDTGIV